ncbi:SET domain-containing protein 9-like [Patiria miniata]|uniref:SET domain-containing protein n=1 Tax=Patiria miniata TaxID=46514 RepID=A0A914AXT3_PATMI|nr:SET domain-containing protein 9-like [Patiria miniata]
MLGTLAKRWKQYKYRFVPWIALNIRKRKVRTVEGERNDKVISDGKVEQSLLLFFTGLSRQDNGSKDAMHNHKVQRSGGQANERIGSNRHFHSVEVPNRCKQGHYWCQYPNKKGCRTSGQTPPQNNSEIRQSFIYLLEELNKRLRVHVLQLYCNLKYLHLTFFFWFKCKCLELQMFGQQVKGTNFPGKELSCYHCSQQCTWRVTKSFAMKPTVEMVCTLANTTSSRGYTCATSQNQRNDVQKVQGTRLRCQEGLEVMQRMLGFTIERQPSSITGGGTGVFVTRGTIPAETVVAMYPGTVYKSWEPILLQSVANPFIFRCLDGTLIDGNDKGISRMVYRSCTQRDRMGPYLTSDLTWLTEAPSNPMAVGQYVNNQNKGNEANVAYQEFDVPDSFPFHLLQFIPNVFYSSTYQQGDSSNPRLMRTVVLVSLREIQCGEELFSSYFTIVH